MSYIPKARRNEIDGKTISNCNELSAQEVGYVVIKILKSNLSGKSTAEVDAYLGALKRAEKEIYRTEIEPRNKQQQFDEGDIV